MSLSTPDSERILQDNSCGTEEEEEGDSCVWDEDDTDSGHVTQSSSSTATPSIHHVFIEPEPESCVSDYSEMADPIKEHLANVEIVQKEALDNELKSARDSEKTKEFVVRGKIQREPDETDEEYNKRLKKINFLSLAQEFAELKKIDADALPFDLHKSTTELQAQAQSPMSEDMSTSESSEASSGRLSTLATPSEDPFTRGEFPEEVIPHIPPPPPARPNSVRRSSDSNDNVLLDSVVARMAATTIDELPAAPKGGNEINSGLKNKMDMSVEGDFDVYNIETTLPQMDWALLEQQLKKAAEEEEKQKKVRQHFDWLK